MWYFAGIFIEIILAYIFRSEYGVCDALIMLLYSITFSILLLGLTIFWNSKIPEMWDKESKTENFFCGIILGGIVCLFGFII